MTGRFKVSLALLLVTTALCCPRNLWAQATVAPTPPPTPAPRATPTPATISSLRVFHCNCFGAGQPVAWAGNVQATSYFQARQQAGGRCLAYLGQAPSVPLIPTPSGLSGTSPNALATAPVLGQLRSPLNAAEQVPRAPVPFNSPCGNCACN